MRLATQRNRRHSGQGGITWKGTVMGKSGVCSGDGEQLGVAGQPVRGGATSRDEVLRMQTSPWVGLKGLPFRCLSILSLTVNQLSPS